MLIEPIIFEEWKDIDFLGIKRNLYKISNFGNVYSNAKNGYLSPAITNGYLTVQLAMENGDRKSFYVHRLVAIAFIPNPDPNNLIEVNHKNLHRDDPFVYNLEWVTKQDNIYHELEHSGHDVKTLKGSKQWGNGYSTFGENNGMAKFTESDVRIMLKAIENGASYKEALEIAGFENIQNNRYNLSHIARGHRWKHITTEYNIPNKIPKS